MPPGERLTPRWIVDGLNVIGSRADGWWRDRRGAMRRLVRALDAFARETGEPVTVVFDGAAHDVPAERVDVRFARGRGPNAADADIAALAASDSDPATVRVVTSDGALAARVRAAGAEVVGAGGFRRRLDALEQDRRGDGRSDDA
ncbi:MAG TPA: NYN domain-containing protein [Solirubrobacteraceae bacterium]|nr:NYN domain-containing protein [Solirubrobacteraceae bacterium]